MRVYDADGKPGWLVLGRALADALVKYARILGTDHATTLSAAFGRYEREELQKKAAKTRKEQKRQLDRLAMVFGHMNPGDIRQSDAIAYLDERAKLAPVSGNREIALWQGNIPITQAPRNPQSSVRA